MQERVEKWLCYWVAKPISWTIYGVWVAIKYAYAGGARKFSELRERWTAWRAKGQLPISPTTKRASRREVVGK